MSKLTEDKSNNKDNDEKSMSNQEKLSVNNEQPPQVKPLKPEEKPFEEFINDHFFPELKAKFNSQGYPLEQITLKEGQRPVVGGSCWVVTGEISNKRKFWLCFETNKITSKKTLSIADQGTEPTLLELFLADERKTTSALLISRLLQRLNGQQWLGAN